MNDNKNHPLQKINKSNQSEWLKKLEQASGQPIKSGTFMAGSIVFFLLDCSGSMSSDNKLPQAKKGGIQYAIEANKKGYKIGLISFGDHSNIVLEPQNNIEVFRQKISKIELEGSTNLTAAIIDAREYLSSRKGERIIFIVTDGYPDSPESAIHEAKIASCSGIEIMTLGTDDADLNFLNSIATKKEFSIKVNNVVFEQSIKDMAKLLPGK